MRATELKKYKRILLERRQQLTANLSSMADEALKPNGSGSDVEESADAEETEEHDEQRDRIREPAVDEPEEGRGAEQADESRQQEGHEEGARGLEAGDDDDERGDGEQCVRGRECGFLRHVERMPRVGGRGHASGAVRWDGAGVCAGANFPGTRSLAEDRCAGTGGERE